MFVSLVTSGGSSKAWSHFTIIAIKKTILECILVGIFWHEIYLK